MYGCGQLATKMCRCMCLGAGASPQEKLLLRCTTSSPNYLTSCSAKHDPATRLEEGKLFVAEIKSILDKVRGYANGGFSKGVFHNRSLVASSWK